MAATAERTIHVEREEDHDRNASCLRRMDPELVPVHLRLHDWSRQAKGVFRNLQLPAESYYHKWSALGIAPNPGHWPEMTDAAWNVDCAIRKLGEIDRNVVWRFYMQWRPVDIWKGIRAIKGRDHFDRILKRARYRVQGILMALE